MSSGALRRIGPAAAFALAFVTQTTLLVVLAGVVPATSLALAGALGVAVVGLVSDWRSLAQLSQMPRRALGMAAVAGLLGGWFAVYVVAANRYSDAPSGSETVFFSACVWGALAVLVAAAELVRRGRFWGAGGLAAGVFAALAGSAGVLANWERPSSFSPLVRFPVQELWMVAGGAAFVAFGWLIARSFAVHERGGALLVSAGSATASGVVVWLLGGGGSVNVAANGVLLVLWALAFGMTFRLWPHAISSAGLGVAGAGMLLTPIFMSGLTIVEPMLGSKGPRPLLPGPVVAASLLVVAGIVRIAVSESEIEPAALTGLRRAVLWAAVAACALSVAGLAWPALHATVVAGLSSRTSEIAWTMSAIETASGWIAVSLTVLALTSARDRSWAPAATALVAAVAYPALLSTPLHVLTTWLAPEIQADFGTEYASITFAAQANWLQRIGTGVASCVLAVVLVAQGLAGRAGATSAEPPLESEDA